MAETDLTRDPGLARPPLGGEADPAGQPGVTGQAGMTGQPGVTGEPDQTRELTADPEPTQWLAAPPPPPPAGQGDAPGQHGGVSPTAEGEQGLATHSPLSHERLDAIGRHLRVESPWMLASAGLLVLLAAFWAGSIVSAFQHGHHITAQTRILRVLAPGSFAWVLGAAVAVALYSAGRRFEVPPPRPGPLRAPLAMGLVLAGAAAVASSALSLVVELTNFAHGISGALAGLIAYAGSLVLAGAVAWWTNLEHEEATAPQ